MSVAQSRPTTPAQPAMNRLTSAARKVFTRSPQCQKKGQGEGSQLQHSGDQDDPHADLHTRPVFMLEIHSASSSRVRVRVTAAITTRFSRTIMALRRTFRQP